MGTTRTAFTTDSGVELCFCLLIEGYDQILTTHSDTTRVAAAYTSTDWTAAVSGMQVPGTISDRMELFAGRLDLPSARFVVAPDTADTFGLAVHKTADSSGNECYLDSDLDNDDTTVTVDATTGFSGTGTIYIGTENLTYTGTTGTTFTGITRGKYAPFKAYDESSQRFGRRHTISTIQGVRHRPLVTDYPRTWAGRMVRCLAHRVRNIAGQVTLDDFTEAETIFCGILEAVGDSEAGNTVLDCVGVNKLINDTVLLGDQWSAPVRPGLYLSAGDGTDASTAMSLTCKIASTPTAGGANTYTEGSFTVVSGAAADHTEATAGWYETDELMAVLSTWLMGAFSGTLPMGFDRLESTSGWRTRWYGTTPTAGTERIIKVRLTGCERIFRFLGFTVTDAGELAADTEHSTAPFFRVYSPGAPLKSAAFQSTGEAQDEDPNTLPYTRLEVVNPEGSWITVGNTDLPDQFRFSTGDWGFLQVGDTFVCGKYDGDNDRFTDLRIPDEIMSSFLGLGNRAKAKKDLEFYGTTTLDDNADVTVRQIVVLQNELFVLLAKMLYSTGTNYYNNDPYDILDAQLGVGIPYELMGGIGDANSFIYSLIALQNTTEAGDITIILDKPTRFGEIIKPELMLRGASFVIDDALYKIATPVTPGRTPDHTLTAANKAADANTEDPQRSRSNRTSRLIRDKVTVEYNRTIDGKYRSNRSVVNLATVSDHGGYAKPLTVKARNTIGGEKAQGAAVDSQVSELAAFALGMFGDEVTEVTRTISRKHFHILPGQTVALTDDSVRNPTTGVRGISSYPAFVEEVSRDWFTGIGEVKLILLGLKDSSRYGIYSPAAKLSAYNTGTGVATLLPNTFTLAADATDDTDQWAVGDKIRFIEMSPSDITNPSTWVDEIDSISSDEVTTVDNNGNGVYDSSLTYVMVSDDRATAASTQQTDAYIADDADGLVQNAVKGYFWAREEWTSALVYGTNTGSVYLDRASTEYLRITDANQTGMDNLSAMTVAMDIRIEELSAFSFSTLFSKWDTGQKSWKAEYWYSPTNQLRFFVSGTGGDSQVNATWDPELCRWYHVACTYDGSDMKVYIDGALINTAAGVATTDIADTTADVEIADPGIQKWTINADNFQFWNRALSLQEIRDNRYRELQGNESGLVTFLPLNVDYNDRTSNDNDFEAPNGATIDTAVPWVLSGDPHRYPANLADDEGEPVSPHIHTNAAITLNNLVSYKTAPQTPWLVGDTQASAWDYQYTSSDSDVWRLTAVFPMHLGMGRQSAGDRFGRELVVSPAFYRVSGSGTVSCRITFTQTMPRGSDWDDCLFREPYVQLEYSTTSTSVTVPCPQQAKPPEWQGVTMVAVELKADNTETVAFTGLPILYYGPLQPT